MRSQPKCQTLHAAAHLGNPVVAYSGLVARLLGGDPAGAVLLCQLWYLTREGERPVDVTVDQLEFALGISAKIQRRARKALVARGWVTELRARQGGKLRIFTRVNRENLLRDLEAAGRRTDREVEHHTQEPDGDMSDAQRSPENVPDSGAQRAHTKSTRSIVVDRSVLKARSSEQEQEQDSCALAHVENTKPAKAPKKEYRVDFGATTMHGALRVIGDLDAQQPLSASALEQLMLALTALRVGDTTTHQRMPFATYSGSDCALVRRKLQTLRPSELAKAVIGATHVDTWAREQSLSLAAILARADKYVAAFDRRRIAPDKERASHVFLEVYRHAQRMTLDDSERWQGVRARMSFLTAAELLDEARQMAAAVDNVRHGRGEEPISVVLALPEVRHDRR